MSFRAPEGNTRREPPTTGRRMVHAVAALNDAGEWVYSTDSGEEADGYVTGVDANGWLVIDTAATEGMRLRALPPESGYVLAIE